MRTMDVVNMKRNWLCSNFFHYILSPASTLIDKQTMQHNLSPISFNTARHDFWPVYQAIQKYYPLGINRESPCYDEYPVMKALEEMLVRNIHDSESFQKVWGSFQKKLQQEFGKEVVGTTFGQAPAFSAFLKVHSQVQDQVTVQKELHFALSLIGPFYTIYGRDMARLTDLAAPDTHPYPKSYGSTITFTVSPYQEYEKIFLGLQQCITAHFSQVRFIPYLIGQSYIEGLSVRYRDQQINTIYHALFNDLFSTENDNRLQVRGDKFYGLKEWETDSPDLENKWTVLPPEIE